MEWIVMWASASASSIKISKLMNMESVLSLGQSWHSAFDLNLFRIQFREFDWASDSFITNSQNTFSSG